MASLSASSVICPSISSSSRHRREITRAAINIIPKFPNGSGLSLPKITNRGFVEELDFRSIYRNPLIAHIDEPILPSPSSPTSTDSMAVAKLYAILEAVSDRIEMHNNIGEQRNNWNSLLLTSINAITLTAATMTGIAATGAGGSPVLALKLSSTLLYVAATGMLLVMNKIQPSQLAEEQRNAARLFKQLRGEIRTKLSIGTPNAEDAKEAMDRVLALDRAYPLPLLGVMLEKFPERVEPASWWPQQRKKEGRKGLGGTKNGLNRNGWGAELEEEMRGVLGVMKRKDKEEYLRLAEKALKLNKVLAFLGPLLTGLASVASAFVGYGSWAAAIGVVAGALASVVITLEHGGQVGMVFEMYRSNAGFFRLMEETIGSNLKEEDFGRRENGEFFEMKVALQLGRSLSELKDLAAVASSTNGEADREFASKLF